MKHRIPSQAGLWLILALLAGALAGCPIGQAPPPGANPIPITVTGTIAFDTGGPVAGATVTGSTAQVSSTRVQILQSNQTTTDANANFTLELGPTILPTKALLDINFQSRNLSIDTGRTADAETSTLNVGTILIPDPTGAEIPLVVGIGQSADGAAYGRVNQPGADLAQELSDGNGPELKNENLTDAYGVYEGDSGGREDQFKIANSLWNGCGEGATEDQKKNTILIMAVTILHETAHWKDDVKKHPTDNTDTPGEEGNQLERDRG